MTTDRPGSGTGSLSEGGRGWRLRLLRGTGSDPEGTGGGVTIFGAVAWEFRAWLELLNTYAGLVEREPERAKLVDRMRGAIAHMGGLLDMLRCAYQLEAGSDPCEPAEFPILRAIGPAFRRVDARYGVKAASVVVRAVRLDVAVRADRWCVERILTSLLENALMHGRGPGCVTVEVRDTDPVAVAVIDEGVGITHADQASVFDPFTSVKSGMLAGHRRMGLSLYMGRRLAELNGGSLVLERSAPDKGSEFVLRLPRAAGPAEEAVRL